MFGWKKLPLPVRVAAGYFVFGLVWIVGSDWLVQQVALSETDRAWLQTYKGAGFIGLSALFIAWLVHVESRRRSFVWELLDKVTHLVPDLVFIRDLEEGRIVEANQRFVRELGVSAGAVTGRSIDSLDFELGELQEPALREQLVDQGQVTNYRQTYDSPEHGPIELLVSSRRVEFGEDEYVCTVAKDITDLEKAYDETIRGWARALELRDDETFAHTLRVTRATVALARELGLPDDELVHIRRGALLHDIGKIGVPDSILLKDGELDDDEWAVIRKHPLFARELLSPIEYLEPALDIPYRHHEKWDGSGYPDGLEGDDIPLPARIFAVIDVWDALRSDRPYRDAWEPERVLDHLADGKGEHFQPEIAETFIALGDERRRALRDVDSVSILERTNSV